MIKLLLPIACLFVFCMQASDSLPHDSGKVPNIRLIGNETSDLGKIKGYGKKAVRFRIKNTGDAPGEILGLFPMCPCVSGTADKIRLEPQEETDVTVVLDTSLVYGIFERGLSVRTDNPERPNFILFLKGEKPAPSLSVTKSPQGEFRALSFLHRGQITARRDAFSPFRGAPKSPQKVLLAEGATWTNRFTLTEAKTNFFLGMPVISADTNKLRATVSMMTNTQGKTSFDVTLVITALVSGRHKLFLKFPVKGSPNQSPIKLAYDTHVDSELNAVPSSTSSIPTEQTLTHHVSHITAE